ncbi:hypothetical protein RFI_17313, partial [Reticulomyxa filosa]
RLFLKNKNKQHTYRQQQQQKKKKKKIKRNASIVASLIASFIAVTFSVMKILYSEQSTSEQVEMEQEHHQQEANAKKVRATSKESPLPETNTSLPSSPVNRRSTSSFAGSDTAETNATDLVQPEPAPISTMVVMIPGVNGQVEMYQVNPLTSSNLQIANSNNLTVEILFIFFFFFYFFF